MQWKNKNGIVSKVVFDKLVKELDKIDKNKLCQLYEPQNFRL